MTELSITILVTVTGGLKQVANVYHDGQRACGEVVRKKLKGTDVLSGPTDDKGVVRWTMSDAGGAEIGQGLWTPERPGGKLGHCQVWK